MNSKPMLSFLPVGEFELKRLEPLGRWIEKWDSEMGRSGENLDPEG